MGTNFGSMVAYGNGIPHSKSCSVTTKLRPTNLGGWEYALQSDVAKSW